MIDREDMLELTRRMTPSRTCFDRMAGGYINDCGELDDSFNIHFLKLSQAEKRRNLELAKAIPFSRTNEQLKEYSFPESAKGTDSMWQLLQGMRSCALKNDALMELFYEQMADGFPVDYEFSVFVFHGVYDVPAKAADKVVVDDFDEVYDFIVGAICPLKAPYEPETPVFGFLYPAFSDRSADMDKIDIFQVNPNKVEEGLFYQFFGKEYASLVR